MADVIVNASDPAANAVRGLILVASVRSKSASLSVSSAMNIAAAIVVNAPNILGKLKTSSAEGNRDRSHTLDLND